MNYYRYGDPDWDSIPDDERHLYGNKHEFFNKWLNRTDREPVFLADEFEERQRFEAYDDEEERYWYDDEFE